MSQPQVFILPREIIREKVLKDLCQKDYKQVCIIKTRQNYIKMVQSVGNKEG